MCAGSLDSNLCTHPRCRHTRAELFRRILAAPVLFFLRTPVGDVLNAFARDQVRLRGLACLAV
jgi:hypothetical protein